MITMKLGEPANGCVPLVITCELCGHSETPVVYYQIPALGWRTQETLVMSALGLNNLGSVLNGSGRLMLCLLERCRTLAL